MTRPLGIAVVGEMRIDPGLPAWLQAELGRMLGLETFRLPAIPLSDRWRDPGSGRYDSNRIVDALIEALAPDDSFETGPNHPQALAVTDVDLAIPGRPFVFGEATLGGPCALMSVARLRSPDPELLRSRALKEAAHEIGHLRGLDHCPRTRCVMFASADVHDTDQKAHLLCSACDRLLHPSRPP